MDLEYMRRPITRDAGQWWQEQATIRWSPPAKAMSSFFQMCFLPLRNWGKWYKATINSKYSNLQLSPIFPFPMKMMNQQTLLFQGWFRQSPAVLLLPPCQRHHPGSPLLHLLLLKTQCQLKIPLLLILPKQSSCLNHMFRKLHCCGFVV